MCVVIRRRIREINKRRRRRRKRKRRKRKRRDDRIRGNVTIINEPS